MNIKTAEGLLLLFLFLLAGEVAKAQQELVTGSESLTAFEKGNYESALQSAAKQLDSSLSYRCDLLFIAGESARNLGQYELAASYLGQLADSSKQGIYAETDFRLAQVEMALGHCAEAARFFQQYISRHPTEGIDLFTAPLKKSLDSCDLARKLPVAEAPPKIPAYVLRPESDHINTAHDETSPFRYADRLYFSSKNPKGADGADQGRLFSSILGDKAVLLPENPKENNLSAKGVVLNVQANRLYCTLCKENNGKQPASCEVWYRDKTFEGKWGHPVRIPRPVNLPGSSASFPACGFDAQLKKEVLFFASDRPGGHGGWDIWCCPIELDGSFGEPFNLPFNSDADEVSPSFISSSQTLFFSSNNANTYGGFDIFLAENTAGGWSAIKHPGFPLNSDFDDMDFCYHPPSNLLYFTSNRPNGHCPPAEPSCLNFDIYTLRYLSNLTVTLLDSTESTALPGCSLTLQDAENGTVLETQEKLGGNKALFSLEPGKSYRLVVNREGFSSAEQRINVPASLFSQMMEEQVFLKKMEP